MDKMAHRIFSQKWQIQADNPTQAFALRKQFREQWEGTLLPVFEKVFDERSVQDEVWHIPRLEVKLKVVNDTQLWKRIPEELYSQLSDQLKKRVRPSDEPATEEETLRRIAIGQHRFESLIYYLENGNLPWDVNIASGKSKVSLLTTIREQWPELVNYCQGTKPSKAFLFRLFQFLSAGEVIHLSNAVGSHLSQRSKEGVNTLIISLLHSGEHYFDRRTRNLLVATLLHFVIDISGAEVDLNWEETLKQVAPPEAEKTVDYFLSSVKLKPMLVADSPTEKVDEGSSALVANQPGSRKPDAKGPPPHTPATPFKGEELQLPKQRQRRSFLSEGEDTTIAHNAPPLRTSNPESNISGTASTGSRHIHAQAVNRIKVAYAGLVLLAPFLERCFVDTDIVSKLQSEIPSANLAKAAALLHFLATGQEEIHEFELGFIKILLGLEPEETLMVGDGLLTSAHKSEAESLLRSVISYWAILKNTSADGVRSAFLQRSALLAPSDEGWKMQVEHSAIDVLLGQLPWGFSIVKLPWMNKPLFTEWETT